MKKIFFFTLLCLFSISCYAQEWIPINMPSASSSFKHILVDDLDHRKIISASQNTVFFSADLGISWKKIFTLKDEESSIIALFHEPTISPDIFD